MLDGRQAALLSLLLAPVYLALSAILSRQSVFHILPALRADPCKRFCSQNQHHVI
mgnify:CR=1 FL=1